MISKSTAIAYGFLVVAVIVGIAYAFNSYTGYITKALASERMKSMRSHSKRAPGAARASSGARTAAKGSKSFSERMQQSVGDMHSKESFQSDALPEDDGSWDPAQLSLEQSVYDSHREFTDDALVSTQGANGANAVRDDTNDVNSRVGLRRVDYVTTSSEEDARTVSSEMPDQIAQRTGTFVI